MIKKPTKILLYGVGFLLMAIVFFVVVVIWKVATAGAFVPDPNFIEKSIFKSPITNADIPNDTMHGVIRQYQCQQMENDVFDCQMTIFHDRKTGADKTITYQLKIEPSGDFWGERWRLLDIKTANIVEK